MSQRSWVPLESIRTTLSIAVELTDAYAGGRPRGPRVSFRDHPESFTRTPGRFYVVNDLHADDAPVTVTVDNDPRFLLEERVIDESELASPPAIERIALLPSPAYPFSAGATLVRGEITDGGPSGDPVADAIVSIDTEGLSESDAPSFRAAGRSDERGEYVLFVAGVTGDDIVGSYDEADGDDRLVHVDGDRPTVLAEHPDTGSVVSESIELPVGETVGLNLTL